MSKNILVVDDECGYVDLISSILIERGYKVKSACDGQEAIDNITKEIPDLIILDIKMPRMNGYEVCKALRNNTQYRDIPILMLTACSEFEDRNAGMEMGAASYITKPFKQETLLALVSGLLGQ